MGLYRRKDSRVWWISIKAHGKRIRLSTGTENKKLAERVHAKAIMDAQEGRWFEDKGKTIIMKEVIERYLKEESPMLSPSSHARNNQVAEKFISFMGDTLIGDVSTPLVSRYKAQRLEKVTPSTVKKELAFLRRVFSIAIDEWELCKENPVKKVIKSLKVNDKRVRFLSPDEAKKLKPHIPGWLKPIVLVASQTGLRKGNILALTAQQVNFDRNIIIIPRTKNGDSIAVPMTSIVRRILQHAVDMKRVDSPYVFCDAEGKPYSSHKVSMAFKRACSRAGVEDLRFHDLRHDFASLLVQSGVSLYKVQQLLGHKDQRMTQRYAHLLPENLTDAVMTIDLKGTAQIVMSN